MRNHIDVFVGVQNGKVEQPGEQGQLKEQTRGLFCTSDSSVGRCKSEHQCHFWRMSSMFEAYCMGKTTWQLSIKLMSSRGYERLQISKDSLKLHNL